LGPLVPLVQMGHRMNMLRVRLSGRLEERVMPQAPVVVVVGRVPERGSEMHAEQYN